MSDAGAVRALSEGRLVILPTETVYGLAADALNPAAVARIFEAKERPSFDPLIVHLPHRKRLADVAIVPPEIAETVALLIEKFWPGPLTLVLPKAAALPPRWLPPLGARTINVIKLHAESLSIF